MTVSHVLRYDDFCACSSSGLEERLFEVLLRCHTPCTIAVIPFVCDPRDLLKSGLVRLRPFLKSNAKVLEPLIKAGLAEIALHGYSHLSLSTVRGHQEFSDAMPSAIQRALLRQGREHLQDTFEIPVRLFVPPWNRLSATTATVLREEGFWLSGAVTETGPAEIFEIAQVPCSTLIGNTTAALRFARWWGENNIVGTMIHDYDFKESGHTLAGISLEQFESLLTRWSEMHFVRCTLVSTSIPKNEKIGRDRALANAALHRNINSSYAARRFLHSAREVYWNAATALRLSRLAQVLSV